MASSNKRNLARLANVVVVHFVVVVDVVVVVVGKKGKFTKRSTTSKVDSAVGHIARLIPSQPSSEILTRSSSSVEFKTISAWATNNSDDDDFDDCTCPGTCDCGGGSSGSLEM